MTFGNGEGVKVLQHFLIDVFPHDVEVEGAIAVQKVNQELSKTAQQEAKIAAERAKANQQVQRVEQEKTKLSGIQQKNEQAAAVAQQKTAAAQSKCRKGLPFLHPCPASPYPDAPFLASPNLTASRRALTSLSLLFYFQTDQTLAASRKRQQFHQLL